MKQEVFWCGYVDFELQRFRNGRNGRETKATTAPRAARSWGRRLEARSVDDIVQNPSLPARRPSVTGTVQ